MGNCITTLMSNVIYMSEKFSMWFSICSLVTCIVLSLVTMLCFGIGLGFNYSYVSIKSKHAYVAGTYKKTRPTNYYGPGYFRPTTKNKPRKPKAVYRVSQEPVDIGVPEDLPRENIMKIVQENVGLPMNNPNFNVEQSLNDFYFKVFKTSTTTKHEVVKDFNNVNVSIPNQSFKNQTEEDDDISDKSSNKHPHINITDEYSDSEAIRVDIAKVNNVDNSSISQTIMSLKQLLAFLKKLRGRKQNFSVQVRAL